MWFVNVMIQYAYVYSMHVNTPFIIIFSCLGVKILGRRSSKCEFVISKYILRPSIDSIIKNVVENILKFHGNDFVFLRVHIF